MRFKELQESEFKGHSKKTNLGRDFKDMHTAVQRKVDGVVEMASYDGNIGFMEVMKFFKKAKDNGDNKLVSKVKKLIAKDTPNSNKYAWNIIQQYTDTKLVGKQFESSIAQMFERKLKNIKK